MKRSTTHMRRIGVLVFGLLLGVGLLMPTTVGAALPQPGSVAEINPVVEQSIIAQLAGPHFSKIHAWRSAGGIVDVQVEVENASSVQLVMAGNISLLDHQTYTWGDVWHFRVTGLTPNTLYNFSVSATGGYYIIWANGSVSA